MAFASSPAGQPPPTKPPIKITSRTYRRADPRLPEPASSPKASARRSGAIVTISTIGVPRQLPPDASRKDFLIMEYTRLGASGLTVSRIALGCMSFGEHRGFSEWSLGEEEAGAFFAQAVELGITFWDTANVYQLGSSEEIVGRAITTYARREEIVLATKVHFPMHGGPGGSGLSRKAIMEQIDASLTRLGTDYVDLYQIHRFDP